MGDLGLIPGLGRSPGEGNGYPLQYSGLENSMDYTVHRVTKSRTWLSDSLSLSSTFCNVVFVLVAMGLWFFLLLSVCPLMEEPKRLV